jgi:hypothetical protein
MGFSRGSGRTGPIWLYKSKFILIGKEHGIQFVINLGWIKHVSEKELSLILNTIIMNMTMWTQKTSTDKIII